MSNRKDVRISDDASNDSINECQRDLTPDLNGGVLKQIVQGGKYNGKPIMDDDVLIHVVGTLKKEGKTFYNTRKREKPWKTKLHSPFNDDSPSDLPKALDIALRTMKKHEIAVLTCKAEYCYGDKSFKGGDFYCEVPVNSEIVFEVELLDFRLHDLTKDKDSGVLFLWRFDKGTRDFYPNYDSEVRCDLISFDDHKSSTIGGYSDLTGNFGSALHGDNFGLLDLIHFSQNGICEPGEERGKGYNKTVAIHTPCTEFILKRDPKYKYIEKRNFTWTLGEGELDQIPRGVELAIENMMVGESALFYIRYDYMKEMLTDEEYEKYKSDSEFYSFIITLRSCERAKEYYEMSSDERIGEGLKCKLKGNHYLTESSNVKFALKKFKRAIDILEISINLDGENSERDELLLACYLNISKAYFDANTPDLCEQYVTKALKMKPTNEKAKYRKGLLLMKRKLYSEAMEQFQNLIALYPTNKAAIRLAKECQLKVLEQSSAEHNLFKKMSKALFN